MMLKPMIILSLLAWSASAAAQDARAPTGKWVVDFADAQCVASRSYGNDADPLHLVLKAPPLGEVMQIAVIKKGVAGEARQVEASIRLDEGTALRTNMLMFSPPKNKTRAYVLNMPAKDFGLVRQAKRLSIQSPGLSETFGISQMDSLLKIIETCVTDLRAGWNIADSEGEQSGLGQRAQGKLASIFSSEDYPDVASARDLSGTVRIALLINESGRVADCTIIETSGVAALDAQTCYIARERAKFEPARGPDGKPARDAVLQRITWRMQ